MALLSYSKASEHILLIMILHLLNDECWHLTELCVHIDISFQTFTL